MKKKVFYRIITPQGFSNLEYPTLEKAEDRLQEFGCSPSKEHKKYWEQQRDLCKIVKVTEIMEEV